MTDNEVEKIKRLKEVRELLGISQQELAVKLGIKRPNLSAIENMKENRSVPNGTGYILETEYKINRAWFETGKGPVKLPPLDTDSILNGLKANSHERPMLHEPEADYKYQITEVKNAKVPIYDVEFEAGVMSDLIEKKEQFFPIGFLDIPEVSGCDVIIRAKGDSMANRINDRDWIGIKRLDKNKWFPMDYIYAIETEQAQIIKYVKKGSNQDQLRIVSHNGFYSDDEIPKSIIKELWSVKAILPFSKIETLI